MQRGIEKGAQKKTFELVKKLSAANKFIIAEIADFASVTEAFVKKNGGVEEVKKPIKIPAQPNCFLLHNCSLKVTATFFSHNSIKQIASC